MIDEITSKNLKEIFKTALSQEWSDEFPKTKEEVMKMLDKGIDNIVLASNILEGMHK